MVNLEVEQSGFSTGWSWSSNADCGDGLRARSGEWNVGNQAK